MSLFAVGLWEGVEHKMEHGGRDDTICYGAMGGRYPANYFTYNIPNTICNSCGHIDKRYLHECPECHSTDVDYATRIIGYMKRVSSFSQPRQKEAARRFYYNGNKPGAVKLVPEPVGEDA